MELSDRNIKEIFLQLESTDIKQVENAASLIQEHLGSAAGSQTDSNNTLVALIDYYITAGNASALNLLCMVRQHQHKVKKKDWNIFSKVLKCN